jgi:hypothetical protein
LLHNEWHISTMKQNPCIFCLNSQLGQLWLIFQSFCFCFASLRFASALAPDIMHKV